MRAATLVAASSTVITRWGEHERRLKRGRLPARRMDLASSPHLDIAQHGFLPNTEG